MGTKLYVGNLSFNTTETDLQDLFAQAGAVQDVMLMQDKFTGKSRGFAFVTMATEQEAQNAITQFNGKTVEGRALTVNEARPREARPQGGGGVGGPVGAVVGGVIGAIAGKAAATGEPIGATAKKAVGLRSARRSRSKPKAKRPGSRRKKASASRKRTKASRRPSVKRR